MKKRLIILLFVLGFLMMNITSCDPGGTAIIEIANKTSYDLQISFIINDKDYDIRTGDYEDITVNKDETVEFRLTTRLAPVYRNPNHEAERIIFKDINTGEIIKEIEVNEEPVFAVNKVETGRFYHRTGYLSLTLLDKSKEGYVIF